MAQSHRRRRFDARLFSVAFAIVLAWGGIGARLFQVQVVEGPERAERSLRQRLTERETAADRGTIFDRQGRQLAVSVDGTTVYANPQEIAEPEETARLLGGYMGWDVDELLAKLSDDRGFVFLARQLEFEEAQAVHELELPGVYYLTEPKRVYPQGTLASQVVGIVDIDNRGLDGLELQYEEALAGSPGKWLAERDPAGRVIPQGRFEVVPAEPGSDLVSTIDLDIQFAAETGCRNVLTRTGAQRCTIVVLQPETGAVLGMAVLPGFDPESREGTLENSAVRTIYEPGSTQKLVTVAAALEEGAVSWDTWFDVPNRIEVIDGACPDEVGCYTDYVSHDTAAMSVKDIVTRSSNVGTILIQQRLGDAALRDYVRTFGLGTPTGVDYPGEVSGKLNLDPSCGSCTASAAIGYSVSVSPLQMAAVFATIANDGEWVQPHLVEEIVDGEGSRRPLEPARRRVVSEETAWTMRQLLRNVVEDELGTGGRAAVPGFSVGGKTGTTRRFVEEVGYTSDVVASFIGMAPIDDPQLVVAVVVDAPYADTTGGSAAAPAFAEVMEKSLHQMRVPPDAS